MIMIKATTLTELTTIQMITTAIRMLAPLQQIFRLCIQEAQGSLLAKDDELVVLQKELRQLKAQARKPTQDSAPQPSPAHHAIVKDQAHPSSSAEDESARVKQSQGVGESGLPSPSLPATPRSQGGSPAGTSSSSYVMLITCQECIILQPLVVCMSCI